MEQLALTVAEACAAARVGRTGLYEAIATGALVARKRGRKTLIFADDLRKWLDATPALVLGLDRAQQVKNSDCDGARVNAVVANAVARHAINGEAA